VTPYSAAAQQDTSVSEEMLPPACDFNTFYAFQKVMTGYLKR
jgi:hypothetical protein